MEIVIIGLLVIAIILLVILVTKKATTVDWQRLEERMIRVESEVDKLTPKISEEFRENRKELSQNLKNLQDGNEKKLEQMRETVDEKLKESVEKRFNESFKTISNQLTQVYQGLGEMKNLATGVGDLKKVMEGVKTRGCMEKCNGAIIADTLTPISIRRM